MSGERTRPWRATANPARTDGALTIANFISGVIAHCVKLAKWI